MSFLKYTGEFEIQKNGRYKFTMSDKKIIRKDTITKVSNPIIDNNFQMVFGKYPEITKNLLNFLFYPQSKQIKDIKYLPQNIPGQLGERNSLNSVRFDVLCKCELCNRANPKKEMIIDIEMQKNFNIENTKRFILYLKKLYSAYNNIDIMVFALVFRKSDNPQKNNGSKTYIEQVNIDDNKGINKFNEFPIYQIDLCYCYKLIFKMKKDLYINTEKEIIQNEGKEWIKFFNISNWCKNSDELYILPEIEPDFFEGNEIYNAFTLLSEANNINIDNRNDNDELKKIVDEQEKKINELTEELNKYKSKYNK